jgi:hypothetical protein
MSNPIGRIGAWRISRRHPGGFMLGIGVGRPEAIGGR